MPHRVATFFRSHSSKSDISTDLKRASKPFASREPTGSSRSSTSASSIASDDRSVKMPENHKRLSFAGMHSPKITGVSSPKTSATKVAQHHSTSLDCVIESPPLVFFGPTASSTGALLSGQIVLQVDEDTVQIDSFKMKLGLEVTRKKPFHLHCQECAHQTNDLTTWTFLSHPATLRRGTHNYPFSFLLPGHLPASMKGTLSTIEYVLRATVTPKGAEPIKLTQVLDVKRSILPTENPRSSVRIFPPTNLVANIELPSVLHPIGAETITMRVEGAVKRNVDAKTQHQWRLKRLTWRLDETHKTISPACPKHAPKLGPSEEDKKGVAHQDVRTIGSEEMKRGWKADYTSADGQIEVEFPIFIRSDAHPICDIKAEDGTEVSHILVVELVVAEEFAPTKKPNQITPTGSARVLRMHFNLTITERSGMGISWDEEQPPLYENVPASPPRYFQAEIYDGPPIPDYENLVHLDGVPHAHISTPEQHGNGEGPSNPRPSPPAGGATGRLSLDDFRLDHE